QGTVLKGQQVSEVSTTVNEVKDTDTKVTGTAKPGSTVTVRVGMQEIGKAKTDENGNYSINIPKHPGKTKLLVTVFKSHGGFEVKHVTVKGKK
ncbi:Ig-like domain-containing protein, partial [Bacillus thuringiensis]|nr:Ig-like domain-containing protein [Bacillus thuringiensis]